MQDKLLYLIATFDEDTSRQIKEMGAIVKHAGIVGKQTPDVPYHITLSCFDTVREEEIKELLRAVCAKTSSFSLSFNHIGLFGLNVLFLAPDVNYELLELHKNFDKDCIKDSRGWTAHVTILIDEAENIQKALPLVAENFKQLKARVESVSLYEFFPKRFIAKYDLK